jgi:enoyl-CoA hydratase/carnithine racemase
MEYFKIEPQDAVQSWSMHNPPMNYLTHPMTREPSQLIAAVEDDQETGALVVRGAIEGKLITHYSVDEVYSEQARTFMGAYNQAVAHDLMVAGSKFVIGVGIP